MYKKHWGTSQDLNWDHNSIAISRRDLNQVAEVTYTVCAPALLLSDNNHPPKKSLKKSLFMHLLCDNFQVKKIIFWLLTTVTAGMVMVNISFLHLVTTIKKSSLKPLEVWNYSFCPVLLSFWHILTCFIILEDQKMNTWINTVEKHHELSFKSTHIDKWSFRGMKVA